MIALTTGDKVIIVIEIKLPETYSVRRLVDYRLVIPISEQ